jgi:hypothetical protein
MRTVDLDDETGDIATDATATATSALRAVNCERLCAEKSAPKRGAVRVVLVGCLRRDEGSLALQPAQQVRQLVACMLAAKGAR